MSSRAHEPPYFESEPEPDADSAVGAYTGGNGYTPDRPGGRSGNRTHNHATLVTHAGIRRQPAAPNAQGQPGINRSQAPSRNNLPDNDMGFASPIQGGSAPHRNPMPAHRVGQDSYTPPFYGEGANNHFQSFPPQQHMGPQGYGPYTQGNRYGYAEMAAPPYRPMPTYTPYYPWEYMQMPPPPVPPATTAAPEPNASSPPAPDEEKMRLEAEIRAYKKVQEDFKAAELQQEREAQIRKDAEDAFQRRLDAMQRAKQDAEKEIERARIEAERTVREKMQAERQAQLEAELERERITGAHIRRLEAELRESQRKETEAEISRVEKLAYVAKADTFEQYISRVDRMIETLVSRIGPGEEDVRRITSRNSSEEGEDAASRSDGTATPSLFLSEQSQEPATPATLDSRQRELSLPRVQSQSEQRGEDGQSNKSSRGPSKAPSVVERKESGRRSLPSSSPPRVFASTSGARSTTSSKARNRELDDLLNDQDPPVWRGAAPTRASRSSSSASEPSSSVSGGSRSHRGGFGQEEHLPSESDDQEETFDQAQWAEYQYGTWENPYQQDPYQQGPYHQDEYAPEWVERIVDRIFGALVSRFGAPPPFGPGPGPGYGYGQPFYPHTAPYVPPTADTMSCHSQSIAESSACQTPTRHPNSPSFYAEAEYEDTRRTWMRDGDASSSAGVGAGVDIKGLPPRGDHIERIAEVMNEKLERRDGARSPASTTNSIDVQIEGPTMRMIDAASHDDPCPFLGSKLWEPPAKTQELHNPRMRMWSASPSVMS